jgi:hypothetical protein
MNSNRRSYGVRSAAVVLMACGLAACGGSDAPGGGDSRKEGQSDFISSPPGNSSFAARDSAGTTGGGGGAGGALPPGSPISGTKGTSTPDRKVEETDLYRVGATEQFQDAGGNGLAGKAAALRQQQRRHFSLRSGRR